jgi:hypothetical protein
MMEKQKHYRQALAVACQEIKGLDPTATAFRSGADCKTVNEKEVLSLSFFDDRYTITLPELEITSSRGRPVSLVTRIILLHYMIRADGTGPAGDLIPYKEIPGGMGYAGVFQRRVSDPLLRAFGREPDRLLEAGIALGGEESSHGDLSFSLPVFPRVSITFVLWRGDDEFPPAIQILFDRSIDRYLPLEDVVVLGGMASKRLIAKGSSG